MPHSPLTPIRFIIAILLVVAVSGTALADGGKELFDKHCTSCHSIGGGDGGGPDLKGVGGRRSAEWLVKIITDPGKLTAEKDPAQAELVKKFGFEMPNVGVNRGDAEKIVAFLGGGAAAPAGAPAAAGGKEAAAPAAGEAPQPAEIVVTKELLATGRDLFTGKQRFAKGGAPCVSCHRFDYPGVYGGALAADLTNLYGKMGETGVRGVLKSLSFPVMKKIYAERPLTDEESAALTALFKDAATRKHAACDPYPAAGLGFFALCLIAVLLFKRRTK
ncbi:cytochrome c [Geomonas subterranea]|uniref:Cytochrome c n=1 Tax=Geomonas subterranea TaxID=2847989 RepID=A0ABX8LN05_9BACT|nr:cytochrome c [Geomonas subterranea]QXE92311.1 cytochrome c [Geomonas subterranea]QXM09590.1 cytochrome c [Geomonas subterranea]